MQKINITPSTYLVKQHPEKKKPEVIKTKGNSVKIKASDVVKMLASRGLFD